MPTKKKIFVSVKFPPEIIKEAYSNFIDFLGEENKIAYSTELHISINNEESWKYEKQDEFFSEYRKEINSAEFRNQHKGNSGLSTTSIFDYSYNRFLN